MTDLIGVEDVEIALQRELTAAETARVEQLISQVSAYIEKRTGLAFAPFEDVTARFTATYHGVVELSPGPATSVSAVVPVASDYYYLPAGVSYGFDGMWQVFALYPNQVVDITYSGGLEEIPADLAGVALDGVLRKFASGPGSSTSGPVSKKMVGGVAYEYAVSSATFSDDSMAILEMYCDDEDTGTLYLGREFPVIPPWNQL